METLYAIFQVFRTPIILLIGVSTAIFINIYLRLKYGNYTNKSRLTQASLMLFLWICIGMFLHLIFPK